MLGPLYGAAQAVGQFVYIVQVALQNALGVMLLLVVLTGVLRRRWLATAAFYVICVALMGVPYGSAPSVLVQALLATLVVTRFGILAAVAYTLFFLSSIWFPLTLHPSAFYITSSVIVSVLLLGLGWCALYTTLEGNRLAAGRSARPSEALTDRFGTSFTGRAARIASSRWRRVLRPMRAGPRRCARRAHRRR